jgi:hypothetical protein
MFTLHLPMIKLSLAFLEILIGQLTPIQMLAFILETLLRLRLPEQ